MTTPAFEVVLAAAQHLEARPFFVGSGSTTTVINDDSFSSLSQSANQWRGGVLLHPAGAVADRARTVTASTQTAVTVSPALSSAPTAGQMCYVLGPNFPPPVLLSKLASLLLDTATVTSVNTSLTTVAGQREYTLPVIATGAREVVEVEVERANTSPIVYDLALGVEVDHERGVLIFDYEPEAGLTIRLRLRDAIPQTITLTSLQTLTIPAYLDPGWLGYELAARCALWRLHQSGDEGEKMTQLVNDLRTRADAARKRRGPQARPSAPVLAFTGQR